MIDDDGEAGYFLRRARQEAQLALASVTQAAASAHRTLSNHYAAKALLAHVDDADAPGAFPQIARRPKAG